MAMLDEPAISSEDRPIVSAKRLLGGFDSRLPLRLNERANARPEKVELERSEIRLMDMSMVLKNCRPENTVAGTVFSRLPSRYLQAERQDGERKDGKRGKNVNRAGKRTEREKERRKKKERKRERKRITGRSWERWNADG